MLWDGNNRPPTLFFSFLPFTLAKRGKSDQKKIFNFFVLEFFSTTVSHKFELYLSRKIELPFYCLRSLHRNIAFVGIPLFWPFLRCKTVLDQNQHSPMFLLGGKWGGTAFSPRILACKLADPQRPATRIKAL